MDSWTVETDFGWSLEKGEEVFLLQIKSCKLTRLNKSIPAIRFKYSCTVFNTCLLFVNLCLDQQIFINVKYFLRKCAQK